MAPLNSLHAYRPVFGVADPHKSPTCGTSCAADATQMIHTRLVPRTPREILLIILPFGPFFSVVLSQFSPCQPQHKVL